jgi:multidrug efflux pump subunit AcrA (membrane-fusion protein)
VYEGDVAGAGAITIPGHGEVTISPERQQLIGVESMLIKKMPLSVTIRAVGRVAYDPELYNFLSEYKQALSAQEKTKESQLPEIQERSEALVRSSELKLRQLGLSDTQMKELLKGDQENSNLLLPTETAWVYGEIYEYEMKLVRPGQMAQITTQALPGTTFEGRVIAIDPIVNAMSRTLKVRIEVENKDKSLTPEMYVDVVIEAPLGEKLAIPEDALFDMGDRQFVFVAKDEGRFVPTEIKVGHEAEGYYEVLKGLMEGEKVITSANFLIDSESRFRAAAQGAGGTKKLEDKKAASNETAPMEGSHAH